MSTAGKVLVVVVILALIGWIFLFAQVAQLNSNWGREIERLTNQVDTLEQDIARTQGTVEEQLAAIRRSQEQRDRALTVLRARLSDVEKLQALAEEARARVDQQIQVLQATNAGLERTLAARKQERQQTEQLLADTRAEVEQLREDVAQRLDTLQDLRQQFLTTRAENEQLLSRLRGEGESSTRGAPPTRAASLSR